MADNKINMSLDDIIKRERKGTQGKRSFAAGKTSAVRRNIKGGRMTRGRGFKNVGPSRVANRKLQQAPALMNNPATVRMVNKLVKRAISQRANQSLITRAAIRRRPAVAAVSRPAVFRARGLGRRGAIARSRLDGRLEGISQRSRVIARSALRKVRAQRPVVLNSTATRMRGRGVSRIGTLVSDSVPVVYEREVVPVLSRQVIRSVAPRIQSRPREVIIERSNAMMRRGRGRGGVVRNVVARRETYVQPVAVANRPIRKRIIAQPQYVIVNNPRTDLHRQQRVQEVYEPVDLDDPRARFVRMGRGVGRQFAGRSNVIQMRDALGIGRPSRVVATRFEPSSSFLQRVPSSNHKGRGFDQDNYLY